MASKLHPRRASQTPLTHAVAARLTLTLSLSYHPLPPSHTVFASLSLSLSTDAQIERIKMALESQPQSLIKGVRCESTFLFLLLILLLQRCRVPRSMRARGVAAAGYGKRPHESYPISALLLRAGEPVSTPMILLARILAIQQATHSTGDGTKAKLLHGVPPLTASTL